MKSEIAINNARIPNKQYSGIMFGEIRITVSAATFKWFAISNPAYKAVQTKQYTWDGLFGQTWTLCWQISAFSSWSSKRGERHS
jgi:hypothetical protein